MLARVRKGARRDCDLTRDATIDVKLGVSGMAVSPPSAHRVYSDPVISLYVSQSKLWCALLRCAVVSRIVINY